MLHISPSNIESYLYYKHSDYKTLEEIKEEIAGKRVETIDMQMGTAWHHVMERIKPGAHQEIHQDGFIFYVDCDETVPVGGAVELKLTKTYHVKGYEVMVHGRGDEALGKIGTDHKLTTKFDFDVWDRYQRAFQWRYYLDALDADTFIYRLYLKQWSQKQPEVVRITDVMPLRFDRYEGMDADIQLLLADFIEFAEEHLPQWMQEKQKDWSQKR